MATTKAPKVYTEVSNEPDCYIMFGKESAGIPEEILVQHQEDCVRIPMVGDIRSLNLSNSVSIVLYSSWQNGFAGMNWKDICTDYTGETQGNYYNSLHENIKTLCKYMKK